MCTGMHPYLHKPSTLNISRGCFTYKRFNSWKADPEQRKTGHGAAVNTLFAPTPGFTLSFPATMILMLVDALPSQ